MGIPPGGLLAVVGPSGSGKTTFLRLLVGLLEPSEGGVLVDDLEWTTLKGAERIRIRRTFGYVQQQPGLLHATLLENVAMPLRWRGMPREAAMDAARESLRAVGLSDLAARNALGLSGGERQRAVFARAIAAQPTVLLLDEFTNHQDPDRAEHLESIVAERIVQGASGIIVAHDLGQVDRIRRASGVDPILGILLAGRWIAVRWEDLTRSSEEDHLAGSFLRRLAGPNIVPSGGLDPHS
ncbi:MAG: ATP-binding cassette domain-containing protein [Thermoplasmata archaeon]